MTDRTTAEPERERLFAEIRAVNASFDDLVLPALLAPLSSIDLTIQQLKVLTVLIATQDGATGRGLSESFGVSMATMSGILDRLVSQGMAERSEDPHDARVKRLNPTGLGRSTMRHLVAARPEFGDDILHRLPLDDLQALAKGMAAVRVALDERHAERVSDSSTR